MRKIKVLILFALAVVIAITCTGCTSIYLETPQYKGIEVKYSDIAVKDEKVNERIDSVRDEHAVGGYITDRGVLNGDTVVMDYEGYIDGIQFEGGTATGASLVVGEGKFIPGFEDGLIGHTTGESFSILCTFPDNYDKTSLRGKVAEFRITIKSIYKVDLPELTDEFVKKVSDCETVDEYKAYIRGLLEKENLSGVAWDKVLEKASFKVYPSKRVRERCQEMDAYYEEYAAYYGMDLEAFMKQYYGVDAEQYAKDRLEYGETAAKEDLVFEYIIKEENLTITDELYAEKSKEYAELYGYESIEKFEQEYGKELVEESILWDLMLEVIVENVVITGK